MADETRDLARDQEELAYVRRVKHQIEDILSIITAYKPLVDSYVSDFFVSRIWETIPSSWWDTICELSPPELASLLSLDTWSSSQVWPLSLLAFRTAVHTLALPRQPSPHSGQRGRSASLNGHSSIHGSTVPDLNPSGAFVESTTNGQEAAVGGVTISHGQYLPLEHCYRRHVKPKKQHEILSLGEVIHQACSRCHLSHVVDVGAGQGHLSRLLAFGYGLQVTTIEASSCHAPKATKYDSEVQKDLLRGSAQKKKKKAKVKEKDEMDEIIDSVATVSGTKTVHQPRHVVGTIDASISVKEFLETLNMVQDESDSELDRAISQKESASPTTLKETESSVMYGQRRLRGQVAPEHINNQTQPSPSLTHNNQTDIGCDKDCDSLQQNGAELDAPTPIQVGCRHVSPPSQNSCPQDTGDFMNLCEVCVQKQSQSKNCKADSNQNFHVLSRESDQPSEHCDNHQVSSTDWSGVNNVTNDCLSNSSELPLVNGKIEPVRSKEGNSHEHHGCLAGKYADSSAEICEFRVLATSSTTSVVEDVAKTQNSRISASGSCKCDDHAGGGVSPFLLTGLHACGDLTATMLRVFVKCPLVAGLASVGCCYMKLTTEKDAVEGAECGYPMSRYVASLPGHQLSWEAREMACHFMDNYHDRLLENPVSLRSHVYRSALQEIIHRKDPSIVHGSVKLTLKKTHELPFEAYAARALGRLGLDPSLTEEDLALAHQRLAGWKQVVALYTLRLSLGPMIETLVLLDRLLCLKEHGLSCDLVPVFDPKVSPRNFVLLAHKVPC